MCLYESHFTKRPRWESIIHKKFPKFCKYREGKERSKSHRFTKNMLVMTNLHNERYMAVRCFLVMHEQTFRSVAGNKNEFGEIPRRIDTNKVWRHAKFEFISPYKKGIRTSRHLLRIHSMLQIYSTKRIRICLLSFRSFENAQCVWGLSLNDPY